MSLFTPVQRAFAQIDDPVFSGVVWRSAAWALVVCLLLGAAVVWGAEDAAASLQTGWLSWVAGLLGGVGAALLTFWLFLPLATVIAFLFLERVTRAVERRYYPGRPQARPAPLLSQAWDGIALGLRILGVQLIALVLTLLLPGIGLLLGWMIAAWAVGRGLFVPVAMLRMDRPAALALYRERRPAVLLQGALMTAGNMVPLLNLLTPVLGVAAMVHVLHANEVRIARRDVCIPESE
jgi:CysZ protein